MDNEKKMDTEMIRCAETRIAGNHGDTFMSDLSKMYLKEIEAMIWWARARAATSSIGWAVEPCADEERLILEEGLETIRKLYRQIDSQLEEMEDACPILAVDRAYVIEKIRALKESEDQMTKLQSQSKAIGDQLKQLNHEEEQGISQVKNSLEHKTLSNLMDMLVFIERDSILSGCANSGILKSVFIHTGFQLVAQLGDNAIRMYLFHLAKQLFPKCNSGDFIEALLALYKRRLDHSRMNKELPHNKALDGLPY